MHLTYSITGHSSANGWVLFSKKHVGTTTFLFSTFSLVSSRTQCKERKCINGFYLNAFVLKMST